MISAVIAGRYRTAATRSWRDDLFDKQLEFVSSEARFRAMIGGRRGGKSEALAYWLGEPADRYPGEMSVYVGVCKASVINSMWTVLKRVQERHPELRFKLHITRDGQLKATWPNGYEIWMTGCSDRSEMEKFRGTRYVRVVIDEAGSYGSFLQELVAGAILPALMDHKGQLAIAGTPPPLARGYFHSVTTGDDLGIAAWPTWSWTALDNPHVDGKGEFVAIKAAMGWSDDHPRFVREYLGRWITDSDALVFPYDDQINGYWTRDLPEGPWTYATGMDLGYVHSTAWVAGSWERGQTRLWLRESYSQSRLIPTAVAAKTALWHERWPGTIYGDSGGPGKAYISEINARCPGVYVQSADKHDKLVAIEWLRGDLKSGQVRVDRERCASLIDEWSHVQWTPAHDAIDERSMGGSGDARSGHADEAHAALYLHRMTRLRAAPVRDPDPLPGTPEHARWEMAEIKRQRQRQIAQQRRRAGAGWR